MKPKNRRGVTHCVNTVTQRVSHQTRRVFHHTQRVLHECQALAIVTRLDLTRP
jgi:hypothetical protein